MGKNNDKKNKKIKKEKKEKKVKVTWENKDTKIVFSKPELTLYKKNEENEETECSENINFLTDVEDFCYKVKVHKKNDKGKWKPMFCVRTEYSPALLNLHNYMLDAILKDDFESDEWQKATIKNNETETVFMSKFFSTFNTYSNEDGYELQRQVVLKNGEIVMEYFSLGVSYYEYNTDNVEHSIHTNNLSKDDLIDFKNKVKEFIYSSVNLLS